MWVLCGVLLAACAQDPPPYPDTWLPEPIQTPASSSAFRWEEFTITPLADWEGQVRVWSVEDYNDEDNREDQLSPIDVAVGWGEAGLPEIYQRLTRRHANRWYHFDLPSDKAGMPSIADISRQSGNMHLIPANVPTLRAFDAIRAGVIIHAKGQLVRITHPDGWFWRSSLKRTDMGDGSCELLLVEELTVFSGSQPLSLLQ